MIACSSNQIENQREMAYIYNMLKIRAYVQTMIKNNILKNLNVSLCGNKIDVKEQKKKFVSRF